MTTITSGANGFNSVAESASTVRGDGAALAANKVIDITEFRNKLKALLGVTDASLDSLIDALFNAHKGADAVMTSDEWTSFFNSLGAVRGSTDADELVLDKQSAAKGILNWLKTTTANISMTGGALKTLIESAYGIGHAVDSSCNLFPDLEKLGFDTTLTTAQIKSVVARVTAYDTLQIGGKSVAQMFGKSNVTDVVSKAEFISALQAMGFTAVQAQQFWNDFIDNTGRNNVTATLGEVLLAFGRLSAEDGNASELSVKDLNLFQLNYVVNNGAMGDNNLSFDTFYELYFQGLCSKEEAGELFKQFAGSDNTLQRGERMALFQLLKGNDGVISTESVRGFLSAGADTTSGVFGPTGGSNAKALSFDTFAGSNGTIERDEFVSKLASLGYSTELASLLWNKFNTNGESMTATEFGAMVKALSGKDGMIQAADVMGWALSEMASCGKSYGKDEFRKTLGGLLSDRQLDTIFNRFCGDDGRLQSGDIRSIIAEADTDGTGELTSSEMMMLAARSVYMTNEQSAVVEGLLAYLKGLEGKMYELAGKLGETKDLAEISTINVQLSQLAAQQAQATGALGKYMDMVQNVSRPLQG